MHNRSAHGARRGAAHVLAALQAPHQVEAAVRKGLLQRIGHLEAHALGQALLRRQRIGALRLRRGPGGMVRCAWRVHQPGSPAAGTLAACAQAQAESSLTSGSAACASWATTWLFCKAATQLENSASPHAESLLPQKKPWEILFVLVPDNTCTSRCPHMTACPVKQQTWTGLSVIPRAAQPYFRAICLLLPPMPQPTSTICRAHKLTISVLSVSQPGRAKATGGRSCPYLPCPAHARPG